ncbi:MULTISPECIES: cyclase family protein [unclassified Paenibacillus]|uniref:cyclase family protein n=1 Tax=unclassified Paenibacillus TaxID=185978 RepID=UPI0009F96A43|nr:MULTISPECIES: cyclase family protein [unclassified Paenibacillus]
MLIDLTHAVRHELPVYPGDRETVLIQSSEIGRDGCNNHLLTVNMHAGTHIDGPMHLLDVHDHLSGYSLESFIGEGCLIEAEGLGTES